MKGQLSIEFIIVFTALLLILATTTMPLYESARADAEKLSKLTDAREAANSIVNALNMVYAGGVGSRQTVEYSLPNDVLSISFVNSDENRLNVRVELDLESDNVLQVSTILPNMGDENSVIVDNENFGISPGFHRMNFAYKYSSNLRRIEIKVA